MEARTSPPTQPCTPKKSTTFLGGQWAKIIGAKLQRIKQRMATHDGAVVMTFIRTERGHQVRKQLGQTEKPWFSCAGHGRDSMVRSLLGAARLAAQHAQRGAG
ncbi:MAG: hypothetical protein ACYCWW_06000 [Deltaproteobacteria bacterium]